MTPDLLERMRTAVTDAEHPGYALSTVAYTAIAQRLHLPSEFTIRKYWGSYATMCRAFGLQSPPASGFRRQARLVKREPMDAPPYPRVQESGITLNACKRTIEERIGMRAGRLEWTVRTTYMLR